MNEQAILEQALQATHAAVALELDSMCEGRSPWQDAVVRLPIPGVNSSAKTVSFDVGVKRTVDRLEILNFLHSQAQSLARPPLLATTYISPSLADACRELGLNFIDTAGNAHIDVPGCLVFISGKRRPKEQLSAQPHTALRTTNGLRIVFALLTQPGLVQQTQRDIADHAGVALGSVGKTLHDLQTLGHLSAGNTANRRLLARQALMQEWAQHYPVSLRHKLNPQRYALANSKNWQDIDLQPGQAAWGAEVAAQRMDGYLKPAEATIYSWEPRTPFIVQHRLRPDPAGEVEILDAFWPFVAQSDDPQLVPALLVYADLMASRDGRNREAAERLWEQLQHAQDSI